MGSATVGNDGDSDDRERRPEIEELLMVFNSSTAKKVRAGEGNVIFQGLDGEMTRQDRFAATTAATCSMFRTAEMFENYRKGNGAKVRVVSGSTIPIAGYGDVTVAFRCKDGWVPVSLKAVAHVPDVAFNVVSLTSLVSEGHSCVGDETGTTLQLTGGGSVLFPYCGLLPVQSGFRLGTDSTSVSTRPSIAAAPTGPADVNEYHLAHGHAPEAVLKLTASQQGIQIGQGLRECLGCSMAKMLERPVGKSTASRADEKLQRIFVGLSGKMRVPSVDGKWYVLVMTDDCTRWTRVYFLRDASEATGAFKMYLAEYCPQGVRSKAMTVQSDNGQEIFGADFDHLCRKNGIMQEFPSAYSPDKRGVADRALGLILDAALAARIRAPTIYPGAPTHPSLWAEAVSWACNALNHTACTDNPEDKSPYELWQGHPPPIGGTHSFLRPAIYRLQKGSTSEPDTQTCFFLGPEVGHGRSGMRVLTEKPALLIARSIKWRNVPKVSKVPKVSNPPPKTTSTPATTTTPTSTSAPPKTTSNPPKTTSTPAKTTAIAPKTTTKPPKKTSTST